MDHRTYEERIRRLDEIVDALDKPGIPLEEALRMFEEGVELLRAASGELADAEERVRVLLESASGAIEARPFDG